MIKSKIVFFFSLLFIFSCGSKENKERVVASYNRLNLYSSEVESVIPHGLKTEDSLQLAQMYINNWIDNQVVINEASRTLTSKERDFNDRIRKYRNSLMIFEWEKRILNKELDDLISPELVNEYYKNNQFEFILQSDIIRLHYIKLNINNPFYNQAIQLLNSEKFNLAETEQFCIKYAVNYFLDAKSWLYVEDLLKEVPLTNTQRSELFASSQVYQATNEEYRFLLKPLEIKLKGTTSPLALEEETIKEILYHKRKNEIIKNEITRLRNRDEKNKKIRTY